MIKNVYVCMYSTGYCFLILMKVVISQEIFEKITQVLNFMKFLPLVFFSCGRTDGHTDRRTNMKKLIGAFRNFAKSA